MIHELKVLWSDQKLCVETIDFATAIKFRWLLKDDEIVRYRNPNKKTITKTIGQQLLKPPRNRIVINRNGDIFDCRRKNLAVRKEAGFSSSIYNGVTFDRRTGRWQAQLTSRRKTLFLGRFDTELEAAAAYDDRLQKLYPSSPWLNLAI